MGNDVVGLAATLELPLAGRDAYAQRFPVCRLVGWAHGKRWNC